MLKIILTLCVFVGASVNGQRVAPGVAPQHYQQAPPQHQQHPPPPQQYQQVHPNHLPPGVNPQQYQAQQQVQYQQVPVQQQQQLHVQQQVPVQQIPVHQQVPVQQVPVQQQQVPVQQVPQHGGHGHQVPPHHTGHVNHGQVLNAANIQHEKEHIQEHLHVPIDTSKMSEAELQFHYFKMHDSDNNNKLDGCELIKSLIHWHVDEEKDKNKPKEGGTGEKDGTTYTDENLADVIDYVLKTMDLNNDGYVDYAEYRKSEEESAKGNKQ